jgi:hypothetical protein
MYKDENVEIDDLAGLLVVKRQQEGNYLIKVKKHKGEFSLTIKDANESNRRTSPAMVLLDGLKSSLIESKFNPSRPFKFMGEKSSVSVWYLYHSTTEGEISYQYAFESKSKWMDVRGYCMPTAELTVSALSNWLVTGVVLK